MEDLEVDMEALQQTHWKPYVLSCGNLQAGVSPLSNMTKVDKYIRKKSTFS